MNWNDSQLTIASRLFKKFGYKVDPKVFALILTRVLNTPVSAEAASEFIQSNVKTSTKLIPIPVKQNKGNWRERCRQIINDLQSEIEVTSYPQYSTLSKDGLSFILCLSDLHFGEIIHTNGEVVFDLDIAESLFNSIIAQVCEAQKNHEVDELIVLLAGDIIEGELIFPAQAFESTGDAFSQVQKATRIIWKGLRALSKAFKDVTVYCVPGNHGRASRLHSEMSNWDNVLYHNLRLMAEVEEFKTCKVFTPQQMWMDFRVRDRWTVHTRHIGVTQATTAGPAKKVMTWLNDHDADLFFYGHYHDPAMFSIGYKRVFKNGSLPPANDFAEKLGFMTSMGQWLVAVSDREAFVFSKLIVPVMDLEEDS